MESQTKWLFGLRPLFFSLVSFDPSGNVEQPGFWESLIPIWGSGKAAIHDFQTGHWGWGIFETAMAISDVFLVKSLFVAGGKLIFKGGIKLLERGILSEGAESTIRGVMGTLRETAAAWSHFAEGAAPKEIWNTVRRDFSKVLESGRLWGMTEGSVFGIPVRHAPWWRAGRSAVVREAEDSGRVIFTDEAARLFRRHPIEGWYSGAKRLLGQYKAPFGDVVFKDVTLRGRHLWVRGAEIGGMEGHSAMAGLMKVAGRRFFLEYSTPHGALGMHVISDYWALTAKSPWEQIVHPTDEG